MRIAGLLEPYRIVAVVGPNRSGTRFVAKALAHSLAWTFVDEKDQRYSQRRGWVEGQDRVLHATAATHLAHTFGSDVGVVFVHRPNSEILASQDRISWGAEDAVREAYLREFDVFFHPTCAMQKEVWVTKQRPFMTNAFDVDYHGFEDHPLWVSDREGFEWDQTCR